MYSKITKTIFSGMVLACASTTVSAQTVNKFGTNSMTIAPTAVLELESTTKGFLAPRMTSAQRIAINAPAEGLLVYQTDGTKGFYSYDGVAWLLSATASNLFLEDKKVFVGNGSGIATGVALSGDALIDNLGVLTIQSGKITTAKILDANVISTKIADAAVTNSKLDKTNIPLSGFAAAGIDVAFGGFKLTGVGAPANDADGATKKYVDDAAAAINTLADGKVYLGNAANVAKQVTLTGDVTITNAGVSSIGTNKVVSSMIAENAVNSFKIIDNSIATADIATGAIIAGLLATDAVVEAKIKDLNVTEAKIAANAVTYAKMQVMSTNKLLGSGSGTAVAEMTLGTGLSFAGTTLNAIANNIANVITVNSNTSLTAANNTVYTSTAMTLTFSAANASNIGLTYVIKKTDDNTLLTFSQTIFNKPGDSFTTLNYAKAIHIQSDGTSWYVINY